MGRRTEGSTKVGQEGFSYVVGFFSSNSTLSYLSHSQELVYNFYHPCNGHFTVNSLNIQLLYLPTNAIEAIRYNMILLSIIHKLYDIVWHRFFFTFRVS